MPFFVYILECRDKSLYTGATNDVTRRVVQHNNAKAGAKYTKARRPVKLVYSEKLKTFKASRTREAEIKRMKRVEKLLLVKKSKVKRNDTKRSN